MQQNKLLKLASKGDKKALQQLYHQYAKTSYYLCCYFLKSEQAAAEATVTVFSQVFAATVGQPVLNEQLFKALVLGKTVEVTKANIQKNAPTAFRDAEKSAVDGSYQAVKNAADPTAEEKQNLIKALRSLQNRQCYTLTMLTCFGLQKHQLAQYMKLDSDKIDASLARAKESFRKTLQLPENSRRELEDQLRAVKAAMQEQAAAATVPPQVEKSVLAEAQKIAKFVTAKFFKHLAVAAAGVIVAAGLVFGSIALFKNSNNSADYDASSAENQSAQGSSENQSTQSVHATNQSTQSVHATNQSSTTEPEFKATKHAQIAIKNYGTISLELYGEEAPITVNNFVKLANEGFYNGLTFHRIISGFMIQGGDPNGDGTGGSTENIKGEFSQNGVQNRILHTRGTISMARSSENDSASSQFFIMHQDATHLDCAYAAFGRVTSGLEIVDKICENTPVTDSNGTVTAENQPVITSIKITD